MVADANENVITSFVVRKDIPEGYNSAGCNESHSLFCSQKRHPKLQNPVTESNDSHSLMMLSDATQNGIHSFVVRKDIQKTKNGSGCK